MKRLWWPLLILLICLPVALLALDVPIPGVSAGGMRARPLPVPDGDRELAYLHTTTNANVWERLVSGVARLSATIPGLTVNDANAFQDSTTAVPELVLSRAGQPGHLRIRWYKLTRDARTADWVAALAARNPAPLAVIGGGSTDRAEELARAMNGRTEWAGPRPALFITTATADEIQAGDGHPRLVDIYDHRTFRFCFTHRQRADAVMDFVWRTPDLVPSDFAHLGRLAACPPLFGPPTARPAEAFRPTLLSALWEDDPYSVDLQFQFGAALRERFRGRPEYDYQQWRVSYSVGGFQRPNADEALKAAGMADVLRCLPTQRVLLVLPTVTQPARRFLRAVLEADPDAARRLVVVTGDGIPVNALLRDGEFAWPRGTLNVPLVLFTHNDPVAWDTTPHPAGHALVPPTSTEEATHFGEMGRVIVEGCLSAGRQPAADADELIARLRALSPAFFDVNGERLGGTGEHVVVLRPKEHSPTGAAELGVWRRNGDGRWVLVRSLPVTAGGRP